MKLYVGLHQPSDAKHFERAFISVNRLSGPKGRKANFRVGQWILDSGAFTIVARHGGYTAPVNEYAAHVNRWAENDEGELVACVSQDLMCEPKILRRTGLTVADHQRITIERYDELARLVKDVPIMPCLQGFAPHEYVAHVRQYGGRLGPGRWVGVGSVCKRNGDPRSIERVLLAIKCERPDLQLHGFGLKATALSSPLVTALLSTADSMAWSYAARRQGRNANDWREAQAWARAIENRPVQSCWPMLEAA